MRTQTVCAPEDPTVTHHFGQRLQNIEKLIFKVGCNSLY